MDNNNGQNPYGQPDGVPNQYVPDPSAAQNVQPNAYVQPDATQNVQPNAYVQPDATQNVQPNPYGQPQDAFGHPNPYAQPATDGGNGGGGKSKKPLSGGAIAGIICGGVVLVAAIVCGIIFIPKLFKSDKEVVLDAFANTFESSATDEYFEDTFGLDDLSEKISETGSSQSLELSIDTVSGVDDFNGLSFSANVDSDAANKKVSGGYVVTYNDTDLLDASFYTDNENVYVAVAELFSGYLTLPCEGGLTALGESALADSLDLSGLTGDLDFFPEDETTDEAAVDGDIVKSADALWENTTFEKQGKETIDVNGETVKAKKYTVTVGEEDLENLIIDMYDAALDEYQASAAEDGTDYYADTAEQVKQYIPTLISEDFVLDVYIADNKVVKISSDAETNILGVKLAYDFYLDVNDDLSGALEISAAGESVKISCDIDNFKNSPNGDITLAVSDEDMVVLNIKTDNSVTDAAKTVVADITCEYEGDEVFGLSVNWNSDRKGQTFNGTFGVSADGEDVAELSFDGKFVDISKGEGFGFEIDNLTVAADGEDLLSMSVKSKIDTNPQVTELDSSLPTYDLSTMTEDELVELITGSDSYESWLAKIEESGLADLFGAGMTGTDIIEDYEDYDEEDEDDDYTEYEDSDSDDMTNVLTSYDDVMNIEILGTINDLDMSYGCEYFVDFEDDNADVSVEYMVEEDTTAEKLISYYSYYDEDAIKESEYNQTITISDGTELAYARLVVDFYGEECARYYFVRDLGDGYFLTVDVVDYTNSISTEEAAETLSEQYFKIQK